MAQDYKNILPLHNNKHQVRYMDVLLLFDDFIVIYVCTIRIKPPCLYFSLSLTSQQLSKALNIYILYFPAPAP